MPSGDILLTNEYYPKGLTQEQSHNYYFKNASKLIKGAVHKQILTFISTAPNKYVIKRNDIDGKPFTLTTDNFERIVHPRVISVSVEMKNMTDYWCLDIDAKHGVPEKAIKICVEEVLEFLKEFSEVISHKVILSSSAYHIYAYLDNKQSVTSAKMYLKKQLRGYFGNQYRIDSKTGSGINIDLSPMSNRGSHTLLHALNLNGLRCMDVTDNVEKFNRRRAIVR